jgi:signal transduction histidine kinase
LVKQTVEQHSGDIRIEDTPGGGATFVVTLPALPRESKP